MGIFGTPRGRQKGFGVLGAFLAKLRGTQRGRKSKKGTFSHYTQVRCLKLLNYMSWTRIQGYFKVFGCQGHFGPTQGQGHPKGAKIKKVTFSPYTHVRRVLSCLIIRPELESRVTFRFWGYHGHFRSHLGTSKGGKNAPGTWKPKSNPEFEFRTYN